MTIVVDPTLDAATGPTLDDIVGRIRRELRDRDNINLLDHDLDVSSTTVTFSQPLSGVVRGSLVSIDDEVMYVWSTDSSNKTVEVLRGHDSEIGTHSAGTISYINGRTRAEIVDAVNDELSSLSGNGLYQMKSVPLTYVGGQYAYSLADVAPASVYSVEYKPLSQTYDWLRVPGWQWNGMDNSIRINSDLFGGLSRVLYKTGFTSLVDGDDDVQGVAGLHAEAADLLVWGACAALTVGDEYKRNDFRTQGDTRRSSEVPYRALALSRNDFQQRYDKRLIEEKSRLWKKFPPIRNGW